MGAGELEAEGFADGRGQAVAIGVVSAPAGGRVQQCVDGADGAGDGFDRGDAVDREDFVRDREVEAVEIFRVEEIEGAREVIGMNLEAKVTPVGEPGGRDGERGEGGVVHGRADRVLDRVAEHGKGGAGERPAVEIGETARGIGWRHANSVGFGARRRKQETRPADQAGLAGGKKLGNRWRSVMGR